MATRPSKFCMKIGILNWTSDEIVLVKYKYSKLYYLIIIREGGENILFLSIYSTPYRPYTIYVCNVYNTI